MKRNWFSKINKGIFTRKKLNKCDVEATNHPEHSTSRTTVYDLPPDILIKIFSWFPLKELCLNISPVCKLWHELSRDSFLWKHLSFKGEKGDTELLCSILSNANLLESVQLVDRLDANAVLQQVSLSNRNLQILIVKRCNGSPQQPRIREQVLLNVLNKCSKLVEITIKESHFYSEEFMKIMSTVLPDLKRINFNHNEHLGSRSLNAIACNCKSLEKVCIVWYPSLSERFPNLYEDGINDHDINELCTGMENLLNILKISAMKLTNNAMQSIVLCSRLHTLCILHALHLTDEGILLLTMLHNLSSLEVSYALKVSSYGWRDLFIRSQWYFMRKLYLCYCLGVNDIVLEIVRDKCPNLQKISLSFCDRITENGMFKLMKGCKQLIFLRIYLAEINVVQCFSFIPNYTPNLRCLVYECTNIKVEKKILENARQILCNLKKKLPNLEIHTTIM